MATWVNSENESICHSLIKPQHLVPKQEDYLTYMKKDFLCFFEMFPNYSLRQSGNSHPPLNLWEKSLFSELSGKVINICF